MDHEQPIVVRVVDSPFSGLNHAVQLGTWVGTSFWPLDYDILETIVRDTTRVLGFSGPQAGRWTFTEQCKFGFVNHADMLMFVLKWRGHPERW